MGLMPQMRERALVQRGVAWVGADGSRRAEMPVTAFDGNGLVSKLEILRGDLVDVLYQATKETVEYRFDTRISELRQDDDGVEVTLADGHQAARRSRRRRRRPALRGARLVFGPEEQFVKPLGGYNAWFTAPDHVGLDGWYLMYRHPAASMRRCGPSHDPAMAKAGLAFALRTDRLRPTRHRPAAPTARRTIRRGGVAVRRAVDRRGRRPTTSTSTRSLQVRMPTHGRRGACDARRRRRLLRLSAQRHGHQPGPRRRLRAGG